MPGVEADDHSEPLRLPVDACLHELFAHQARQTPDALAVTCNGQSLTYAELDARSTILALYLQQQGVQPESLVGLCVERSLDMIVGLLGILKAGGAYVPLDPTYPGERLDFMIRDSGVQLVLTHAAQAEKLAALDQDVHAISLGRDWPRVEQAAREGLEQTMQGAVQPHHLAYVIYTSGRTGTPKGTLVQHNHVVRLFSATDQHFHFNHTDVWTLFHSLSFDFSVWEIWGALLYGGRLVIVPHAVGRTPREFYDLLMREQVTVLNQIPTAFMQLIPVCRATAPRALPLRYVIFGGEALPIPRLKPWFDQFGEAQPRLINMYGITETTVHVTYYAVTQADTEQAASITGKPLQDLTIAILDRHGRPTPMGVPGEVYVGGAGVCRGYLQRPGLTAQRFLPAPLQPGSRLYRTGDLARWLPTSEDRDGRIEYLGRLDNQVKIRGFRIELQEIERQLLRHPQVSDGVVVVKEVMNRVETSEDHKQLVAYYVPTRLGAVRAAQLRAHLRAALPDYMVPAAFVELAASP